MSTCDVAIVGAGPYGLSAAAHLNNHDVRVFGKPLSFWRTHMPLGMYLRSPHGASSLSAPGESLRLSDYEAENGIQPARPLPLSTFLDYASWFQRRAGIDVDERFVSEVALDNGGFRITLEDGETVQAKRVVSAAGIEPFAWRPPEFSSLPADRVSHTVDHPDLARFSGSRVAVIGAGQSAVESTALLAEAGARPELIARASAINWLVRSNRLHRLAPIRRLLYGPSDIGPAGVSWLVELPGIFRRIPRRIQDPMAARAIRPAASAWLVERVADVPVTLGRSVVSASWESETVRLTLDDQTSVTADHVLLATGYRVDVSRYGFLSSAITESLQLLRGFPVLRRGFESSIPGLHFLGAPAAWSFGPLFRFVAGTSYACRALAQALQADLDSLEPSPQIQVSGTSGEALET